MIEIDRGLNDTQVNFHRRQNRQRSHSNVRSQAYREVLSGQRNVLIQVQDRFVKEKSQCPVCQKQTMTIIRKSASQVTWVWCALSFITTLCLVPFMIEDCNDRRYYCAECLQLKNQAKAKTCTNNCRCW